MKVLLLGEDSVGKSSLFRRFTGGFHSFYETMKSRTIVLNGKNIRLEIWDDAHKNPSIYRGAHGVIFMYDVTNELSYDNLNTWFSQIDMYANEKIIKLLVIFSFSFAFFLFF